MKYTMRDLKASAKVCRILAEDYRKDAENLGNAYKFLSTPKKKLERLVIDKLGDEDRKIFNEVITDLTEDWNAYVLNMVRTNDTSEIRSYVFKHRKEIKHYLEMLEQDDANNNS